MGWGREPITDGSQSPSDSPVEQPYRRMTTGKIFHNFAPGWLNEENHDCPLLRPVFEAKIAPAKITIPELTVTGNPFAPLVEQGPPETSQKAPVPKSVPVSADGTPLMLGTYAVETPPPATAAPLTSSLFQTLQKDQSIPPSAGGTPLSLGTYAVETPPSGTAAPLTSSLFQTLQKDQSIPPSAGGTPLSLGTYAVETPPSGTAAPLTSSLFQSLDQIDHDSDRKSSFTPPTQTPTLTLTIPPSKSTPDRPVSSFQAFLAARQQQRELSANTQAVKETALKTRTYLAGRNTDYQDHLLSIQQLMTYAKTYRQSWHYVVGLYIQRFRDPSTFQVAPHCWEKDAWKADMLEKNPGSFLIWPDPARSSIEHEIMEQLRGSEFKRQAMEAAIVDWSHSCQPQEVINVMSKAGWTRRSEYVFGTNWSVMDTIKRMDEGPEKMSLLAKAKSEAPLFFRKCMEDEMCGIKRILSDSLPTGRHCHRYHPTSKRKQQDEGKGPFGSGRLRRKGFTRQPEPPKLSGIDDALMQALMHEKIQQEKNHARWRKRIAAKDGTYSHPQPKHMKPTQVILHGYSPNNRDKAVAAYESISKGMICEDYHRDLKTCRYPGVANPPRKRPLTTEEGLLSRYQGGSSWIRVTFDTIKAAQEAVRQSPHRIGNHLVFAHMYDGFGPQEDMPIPWQDNCTAPNQDCGCS